MNRLVRNAPVLREAARMSPSGRAHFFRACSTDVIKCLVDLLDNVLRGNIPLSERERRRLRRKATQLREFASRGRGRGAAGSLKQKRRFLTQQKGGIFPFLVPLIAALPALSQTAAIAGGLGAAAGGIATAVKAGQSK